MSDSIQPDGVTPEKYAELLKKLAAMEAAEQSRKARAEKKPGWYDKTAGMKPPKKAGSKPGRLSAERIITDKLTVSFYVGGNGKLTIGGVYGTRGATAWKDQAGDLMAYLCGDGPDSLVSDLERIEAAGVWSDAPAVDPGDDTAE